MPTAIRGHRVLLVDDSIVRGRTLSGVVDLLREAAGCLFGGPGRRPSIRF